MAETFPNPDDTPPQPDSDTIQHWLSLHAAGDAYAKQKLLENSMQRLELLTRRMLADNVWLKTREETGDVLQNASIRLWRALHEHQPATTIDFFRLAACLIRRELIDLSRHHLRGVNRLTYGLNAGGSEAQDSAYRQIEDPGDQSRNETWDPARISRWTDFHDYVERLNDDDRLLFDLLWYQELPVATVSSLLGIPMRTLGRRWKAARVTLYRSLFGEELTDESTD